MYPVEVRITPDPTPFVGTWYGEKRLDVRPSAVMVTTDSRAAATTAVMSASVAPAEPVFTAWALEAGPVGWLSWVPTRTAAVPVEASVAESTLTARSVPSPRARRGRAV